jgi:transcriptional regulator of acetoin/glycerol metabolism
MIGVRMGEKMSGYSGSYIEARLRLNAKQRDEAEAKLETGRVELAQLLAAGKKAGLAISGMANLAGISRETAHKLIRERETFAH